MDWRISYRGIQYKRLTDPFEITRDILCLIRPSLPPKCVSTYAHSTNVEDDRNAPKNDRLREQLVWSGRHVAHRDNGAQQMGNRQ